MDNNTELEVEMNDHLKFRVYDCDKYVYSTNLQQFWNWVCENGLEDKVEQCTTEKADKSHRGTTHEDLLIYEGDILIYSSERDKHPVVVRRSKENEDNYPGFRTVDLWEQYGKVKIIGNIHTLNVARRGDGYKHIIE